MADNPKVDIGQVLKGREQIHILSAMHATGVTVEPYRRLGAERVPAAKDPDRDLTTGADYVHQSKVSVWFEDESEDDGFVFPSDPQIAVAGQNTIAKRSVLKNFGIDKSRGTVKELWSTGDYSITISGMFISNNGQYPYNDVLALRNYCEARRPLCIQAEVLLPLGIRRIVVDSLSLPHTNGMANQNYIIQATSDDDFELFVKQ